MNRRIAKKVLRDQDRYSHQQHIHAAHRLYKQASQYGNGPLAFAALTMKPRRSYPNALDDQLALHFELMIGQNGRREPITVSRVNVVPPPPVTKPAFRADGQVHNFGLIPWVVKKRDVDTLTKYQIRDQNRRAKPKRSVADFA